MALLIRRAVAEDYPGIRALLTANLIDNLPAEKRGQGFLSTPFSLADIAAVAGDLGIVVARDDDRVVGFAFASRIEVLRHAPLVDAMLRALEGMPWPGRELPPGEVFLYGPVCIAESWRGRGLLRRLYAAVRAAVEGQFRMGVAFVAEDNPHSLDAHVKGLGMACIGQFVSAGKRFHILAFESGRQASRPLQPH